MIASSQTFNCCLKTTSSRLYSKNTKQTKLQGKYVNFTPLYPSSILPPILTKRISKIPANKKIKLFKSIELKLTNKKILKLLSSSIHASHFNKKILRNCKIELKNQEIKKISNIIAQTHAFEKHASEFGFCHIDEMTSHIEQVIKKPTLKKKISFGRTAYWDDETQSVVIINKSSSCKGTTFVPKKGIKYFQGL